MNKNRMRVSNLTIMYYDARMYVSRLQFDFKVIYLHLFSRGVNFRITHSHTCTLSCYQKKIVWLNVNRPNNIVSGYIVGGDDRAWL